VPAKTLRIKPSKIEREEIEAIRDQKHGRSAKTKTAKTMPVVALLLCDEGLHGSALKDLGTHQVTGLSIRTNERLRECCCGVGSLEALQRKARTTPGREIKITGKVKARITRLACSKPPAGHAQWTLRLIADQLVGLGVIESISRQSAGTVLNKANSSHGRGSAGASHPSRTHPS